MTTVILPLMSVLLMGTAVPVPTRPTTQVLCVSEADDIAALRMFEQRINAYVERHRLLVGAFSSRELSSDLEAAARANAALADALRVETAGGTEIFSPEIGDLIRVRLANNEAARKYAETNVGEQGEGPLPDPRILVNRPAPWAPPVRPAILRALPELPAELEYRFVERALVLVDVDANLVVDVLDDALPWR